MTTADAEFRTREPLMAVKRFYHSTSDLQLRISGGICGFLTSVADLCCAVDSS
jgi:hypothetical protein